MTVLKDLAVNLAAAFVGLLIGVVWVRGKAIVRKRRARHFWRPFALARPRLVLGRFLDFNDFERSGLMGAGDALTLAELRTGLAALNIGDIGVRYSDAVDGDWLQGDLILLGGPDNNRLTRRVCEGVDDALVRSSPAGVFDSRGRITITPRLDRRTGLVERDFGVILKTRNPFNPSRTAVCLFGGWGYGTWAGVRYAFSEDFYSRVRDLQSDCVLCFIDAEFIDGTPVAAQLRAIYGLDGTLASTAS